MTAADTVVSMILKDIVVCSYALWRLRDRVNAVAVTLAAHQPAGPRHGTIEHVPIFGARRLVLLHVLALDHHGVDVARVEHVQTLRQTKVVERRVVLDRVALEGEVGNAGVDLATVLCPPL